MAPRHLEAPLRRSPEPAQWPKPAAILVQPAQSLRPAVILVEPAQSPKSAARQNLASLVAPTLGEQLRNAADFLIRETPASRPTKHRQRFLSRCG